MATFRRRFLLVLGLVALGGACNPLLLPFFLFAPESKFPAEFHQLAAKDKEKEVRVVILTHMGLSTNTDLLHADRDIGRFLAKHLQELCKYNGENVTVVNPLRVEEYKNSHPDWDRGHSDLGAVGKHFKADYVIYLEVNALSMYQPGTANQFYRGQANLTVSLLDVRKPDDFTTPPRQFSFTYPNEARGGNIPVDFDMPKQKFRELFLSALARKLSWFFTAHPTSQHRWCE